MKLTPVLSTAAAAAALLASALPATAAMTVSVDLAGGKFYQQSGDNPCIITGANCQTSAIDDLVYNNSGNMTGIEAFSPAYDADTLISLLGSTSFYVGFDAQDTSVAQNLDVFQMWQDDDGAGGSKGATLFLKNGGTDTVNGGGSPMTGATLEYTTNPGYPTGTTSVPADVNKGAGYADYLIGLMTLTPDTFVQFFADMSNMNDGPDRFFLISSNQPSEIPVPAALPLLLTAFAGLGVVGWRRRGNVA